MSKVTTLKQCCDFQEGYVNPSQKIQRYFDGNIKWLRASDLNGGHIYCTERTLSDDGYASAGKSAKMFARDTLAISKSGTIGALGILKDEMCGNRAVINLSVRPEKADLMYVFYTLKYKKEELISKAGGSIQKNLYVSALETLSLNHAEKTEQAKISQVLATLDAKIELNNRINAELEAMAKTLYDYWFVQFDFPFDFAQGKPDTNGKPYKTSGGKMIYDPTLKREIPEGWTDGTLEDLGQIVGGSTPTTTEADNFCKDGTPWITPNDLSDNQGKKFITRGTTDVSEAGIKSASLKKYPKGTVLLSSRAPIGYMAIARNELTTNQGFKSFVPNKGYSSAFIYYTVNLSLKAITQYASGSTFKEVSASVLKTVKIVLPQKRVSEKYTAAVSDIFARQGILEQENEKLVTLRDWLLPMLMNGQVTVQSQNDDLGKDRSCDLTK